MAQPVAVLPSPAPVREPPLASVAASEQTIDFAVVRGRRGFDSIRDAWQHLLDLRGGPVALAHAPQWYDAYLHTSADPERMYFFVAHRRSELVAIFPFERRTLFVLGIPLPAWVLPHHDHMPFSDVIAPFEELPVLVPPLLRALRRHGTSALLVARNVLSDSSAASFVGHASFEHHVRRQKGDCHYLACGQSYDSVRAAFSRKHRANLRRHRTNLSALGTLQTEVTTELTAMESRFSEFLRVESSGWKGRAGKGTAIALHPDLEAYYRRLLHTFGIRGECELSLLRLNGQCIAAQFCVTIGGVWYLLKIAYDEQYAKYSPGSLLLEEALVRLCADAEVRVANLASDALWHLNWNPASLGMADFYLGVPGIGSGSAIFIVRVRMRLVREFHALRDRMTACWTALLARMSPPPANE